MTDPAPIPLLDEAAAGAIVDALAPALGLPLPPEWRASVVAHLRATAAAACLVLDAPLDDAVEAAPVFRA